MRKMAFTLVELMVVLVIMAIITAWGLPNYNRTQSRAKAQSVMRSMRMMYNANLLYLAHHGDDFCTSDQHAGPCALAEVNNMTGSRSLSIVVPSGVGFTWEDIGVSPAHLIRVSALDASEGFNVLLMPQCPLSETNIAGCWTDGAHPNPRCNDVPATSNVCP